MPELRHMVDLRNDYVNLVNWLLNAGQKVTSRDLATREVTGVTLVFKDGAEGMLPVGVGRGVNLKLAAVEALQLLGGVARSDLIQLAAPSFADVLVKPDNPDYGAYGPRLADRLYDATEVLRADWQSRRAVATIWEPRDLTHDGDRPCTLSLQFLIRSMKLQLHVTMRSQDVWLGLPYDAFMFSQVQRTIARQLGVGVGAYVHHVGSFHIYESDVERARDKLTTTSRPYVPLPDGLCAPARQSVTDVASRILDGQATTYECALNPWYTRQLTELLAQGETD